MDRRRYCLSLFIVLLALAIPPAAYAGGYNTDQETTTTMPHGGYTTTGNKCRSCHAIHMADSTQSAQTRVYRLLRPGAANAATACQYCHGEFGITSKKAWLDTYGHGLSVSQTGQVVAPDDTTYTEFRSAYWGCIACHSPHAANTVVLVDEPLASSQLLRRFPNPLKPNGGLAYNGATGTLTLTQWCTNCHEANYGLHTAARSTPQGTRYGHDVSSAGYVLVGGWARVIPTDSVNNGPTCRQCHSANSATTMSVGFPHGGGNSWAMLAATSAPTQIQQGQLDKLCATEPCHKPTDLP